jgi:cyclopropane-fatty-acyl-phospholipid synthase
MTHTAISPDEAAAATSRHYDLPPEMFATFLGPRMKYTCGLYTDPAATLDEAQEAKLAFIARQLGITGGESVLDIGTGWGSLAFYLAQTFGCQVTGVTPSQAQARYVAEQARATGLDGLVRVWRRSVYDLDLAPASFDGVALVGVIEHLPDHRRALGIAARLVRRQGSVYVSASCYRSQDMLNRHAARPASQHVTESVFGYGLMRPLSVLVEAAERAGLSMSAITDLTPSYERTIADWLERVRAASARIDAIVPGYSGELAGYLETANAGWGYTTKHYAFTAVRSRLGRTQVPQ